MFCLWSAISFAPSDLRNHINSHKLAGNYAKVLSSRVGLIFRKSRQIRKGHGHVRCFSRTPCCALAFPKTPSWLAKAKWPHCRFALRLFPGYTLNTHNQACLLSRPGYRASPDSAYTKWDLRFKLKERWKEFISRAQKNCVTLKDWGHMLSLCVTILPRRIADSNGLATVIHTYVHKA